MKSIILTSVLALGIFSWGCSQKQEQTPVELHGKLSVSGRQLIGENGEPVQLKGVSSHGLFWFSQCFNTDAVRHLASEWNVNVIRLAMYPSGYLDNPPYYRKMMEELIDEAGRLGIYCIIDWHVLEKGNPNDRIDDAIEFWEHFSKRYRGSDHVLYEICNEPNHTEWDEVRKYAETIIPLIRNNDEHTVILVGTPHWSSDLNAAAEDPLAFDNIMYTFHFYSKSHRNRQAFLDASREIPIFVSEWGTSENTGNDGNDFESADQWLDLFDGNNPDGLKISWINWSFCDKDESSAALLPGSCVTLDWSNTSPSGTWIRKKLLQGQKQASQ